MPRAKSLPDGPQDPAGGPEAERYYRQYLRDVAFWDAHRVVAAAAYEKDRARMPTRRAVEAAAKHICDFAASTNDRHAWAFVFRRFMDFVEAGRRPPRAMLDCMTAMFAGFPASFRQLLAKPRRGRPSPDLRARGWEHTNLALFEHYREEFRRSEPHAKGSELNQLAAQSVEDLREGMARRATGARSPDSTPRRTDRPMSSNSVLKAAKRAGIVEAEARRGPKADGEDATD